MAAWDLDGRTMSSESQRVSWRAVSEVAAALGVLLGLLFVGIEIGNNTSVARAEARREAAAQNIEFIMQIALDDDLNRLHTETWTVEFVDSLTPEDRYRLFISAIALTLRLENIYLQYQEGLLDESSFGAYGMFQPHLREPWFQAFWRNDYRSLLDPDFVRYFERANAYTR